jgi:hypothetical protein
MTAAIVHRRRARCVTLYSRGMRRWAVVAVTVATLVTLAGCAGTTSHKLNRSVAVADTTAWVEQAVGVLKPATTKLLSNAVVTCPTDHGLFVTSLQWRNLTSITAPGQSQQAVFAEVKATFENAGWTSKVTGTTAAGRTLALTAPRGSVDRGLLRIISAPNTAALTVAATSACYDG